MEELLEQLYDFYQIDGATLWVMILVTGAAAYKLRDKLTNPATVWVVLMPLFLLVAATTYSIAAQMNMFSPKRMVEWITYTMFSASIGAIMGILCVAVFRIIQDKFITAAHIRATLKRDAEQAERGYPAVDV